MLDFDSPEPSRAGSRIPSETIYGSLAPTALGSRLLSSGVRWAPFHFTVLRPPKRATLSSERARMARAGKIGATRAWVA